MSSIVTLLTSDHPTRTHSEQQSLQGGKVDEASPSAARSKFLTVVYWFGRSVLSEVCASERQCSTEELCCNS